MDWNRRDFLKGPMLLSLLTSGRILFAQDDPAALLKNEEHPFFGPLSWNGDGPLRLPKGFTSYVLEKSGNIMTDGLRVPGVPDGMGAFPGPNGTVILMRNHEVGPEDDDKGPYGDNGPTTPRPHRYDSRGYGGVSRMVVDGQTFQKISSNLVLEGTFRNCAGGVSPWGWLSCEETMEKNHGFVFLCPTDADSAAPFRKIEGYGRFNHEAVAIDTHTMAAYLTEDQGDGCLYRFWPHQKENPFEGTLQALVVTNRRRFSTSRKMRVGENLLCEWVNLQQPVPKEDTLREEAQEKGAATFSRGEGIVYHEGSIFVCCTNGGAKQAGQIFRYQPDRSNPAIGKLTLVAESPHQNILNMPDNITMSPWGGLFMAEDGGGVPYIRFLSPSGKLMNFAQNAISTSELAGICFSPDGQALFVNIQGDGLTVCIKGPFKEWHRL